MARGLLSWVRNRGQRLHAYDLDQGPGASLLRAVIDRARAGGRLDAWLRRRSRWMFCRIDNRDLAARAGLLRAILYRLRDGGRFDAAASLLSDWPTVEQAAARRFGVTLT